MTQTYRLYEYFLPKHYDLSLTLERETRTFHGEVTIHGHKPHHNHPIMLHAKDLTLSHVAVNGELTHITPMAHNAHRLDIDLPAGDYSVSIKFSGHITDPMHGLYPCYYEHKGVKKELLATQFESHHAREVFPCVDEPEAKATFDLTLTTEPDVTVLSNMPEKTRVTTCPSCRSDRRSQESRVTIFETTPRMSTYLLAFVVGELHATTAMSKNGTKVSVYSTLAQPQSSHAFALRESIALLDHYEDYFGVPFPLPKCDHIALPDFAALAMENWGLITYREGYLLATDATPLDQRQMIASVIAHELAHQWFGNLVTMRWWDDLWLNESFANIMQYLSLDVLHPEWRVWDEFAAKESLPALSRDQFANIQPIKYHVRTPDDIAAVFDKAILYCKGSRLIRMAIAYIGEASFRSALRQYFTDYAYGNTVGHDLWRAMHAASGSHIEALMEFWLTHAGLPMVHVSTHDRGFGLAQRHFAVGGPTTEAIWPIPLAAYDDTFPHILHDRSHDAMSADSPWINRDGVGHFVALYDDAAFETIVARLDQADVPVAEHVVLLYESLMLAQHGDHAIDRVLVMLERSIQSHSSAVWLAVAMVADTLSLILDDSADFAAYMRRITRPAPDAAGEVDNADPGVRKTRGQINELRVKYGDRDAIAHALALYRECGDIATIDGESQAAVWLAVVREGTPDDMKRLIALHDSTADAHLRDMIARALCASRDERALAACIEWLDQPTHVKPQDVPVWFAYMMRNPRARSMTWHWLTHHWDWLVTQFGGGNSLEKFPMYAARHMTSHREQQMYEQFFAVYDEPSARRAVSVGINDITARVEWITRDKSRLQMLISRSDT